VWLIVPVRTGSKRHLDLGWHIGGLADGLDQ
jgi:hypothetical protein